MAEDTIKKEEAAEEVAGKTETKEVKKGTAKKDKKAGKEKDKVIAELTDNLAKEKNDYLRLMAEFETFRRRSAEEKLNLVSSAAADTIKGLLPVLDDCERAIKMLESSSDEAAK